MEYANRVYLKTEDGDVVYFQCNDYQAQQVLVCVINNLTDATAQDRKYD